MFENQPFNFPSQNHKKIVGFQHLRFISACTAKKNRTSLARLFKQKLKNLLPDHISFNGFGNFMHRQIFGGPCSAKHPYSTGS